jgi:hypothetical protein
MVCAICRFATEHDDVAVRSLAGRPVCLRCYGNLTNTSKEVPHHLRRPIEAALAAAAEAA